MQRSNESTYQWVVLPSLKNALKKIYMMEGSRKEGKPGEKRNEEGKSNKKGMNRQSKSPAEGVRKIC